MKCEKRVPRSTGVKQILFCETSVLARVILSNIEEPLYVKDKL